jgi:2-polyprenyl-6-methoxyphenol hydroxylase-like FAD-dependent oxidoreductase
MTLALALQRAGLTDVEIYESAPAIKELGVGVNILPHAVRELAEMDLLDDLEQVGIPTSELVFYSSQGQRIWREPRGLAAGYRWPQFSINRGELLGLLYRAVRERLGESHVHVGHHLKHFETRSDGSISADFIDRATGTPVTRVDADVLVGCDGIHSVVRRSLYPNDGSPRWNGIILWRGYSLGVPFLTGRSMVQIGHTQRMFVVYPMSKRYEDEGRALLNWVVLYKKTDGGAMPREAWDHTARLEDALDPFADAAFDFLDVPSVIRQARVLYQYPFVDRDPVPTWDFGRVTLLGDAAHPMVPLGSNGASQAIVDARVLAHELALRPSIEAAVAAYDAIRRPATSAVVLANRDAAQERSMNIVAERAPNGFADIDDVISRTELAAISRSYQVTAGFEPQTLNQRASLSVRSA